MVFYVDSERLQRGRGLGGILGKLFSRLIPFGKSFARTAVKAGKDFVKSDIGQEIVKDTLSSSARAASRAILNDDLEGAQNEMLNSLKRSKEQTQDILKKIAKRKLDKILTGKGSLRKRKHKYSKRMKTTLLD